MHQFPFARDTKNAITRLKCNQGPARVPLLVTFIRKVNAIPLLRDLPFVHGKTVVQKGWSLQGEGGALNFDWCGVQIIMSC